MEGEMLRAILHSADHLFNSDGAFWILALDGVLLIPLIFALFFFPVGVLMGIGAAAVLTIIALVALRAAHANRHRPD
jgi:hypothetical protein